VGRYTVGCVTDLPDALLPEGQASPDLFDVESDHSGVLSDEELVEVP